MGCAHSRDRRKDRMEREKSDNSAQRVLSAEVPTMELIEQPANGSPQMPPKMLAFGQIEDKTVATARSVYIPQEAEKMSVEQRKEDEKEQVEQPRSNVPELKYSYVRHAGRTPIIAVSCCEDAKTPAAHPPTKKEKEKEKDEALEKKLEEERARKERELDAYMAEEQRRQREIARIRRRYHDPTDDTLYEVPCQMPRITY